MGLVARNTGATSPGEGALAGEGKMMAVPRRSVRRQAARDPQGEFLVVESRPVDGLVLAVVEASADRVATGMRVIASETGEMWEVRGIAFAPIQTIERGRLGVLLAPVGHGGGLPSGVRLTIVSPEAAPRV